MRVSEKQAMCAAVFAIAAMGRKIHVSEKLAKELSGYSRGIVKALIVDASAAWAACAFVVERPFYGEGKHGWRLCRYLEGSAQRDVTDTFLTAREFYMAMRAVEQINTEIGR